jgi:predicted transcriptional regulator
MRERPLSAPNKRQPRLTPEQVDDVRLAVAEADRGDFATDEEMAALWKKCGL